MDRSLRGASLVALDLLVLYTVGLPSYTCQQHSSKRQASAFEDPKIETSQTTDYFHAEDCISAPLIVLVAGRLSSFLPFLAHRHATVTGPLPSLHCDLIPVATISSQYGFNSTTTHCPGPGTSKAR